MIASFDKSSEEPQALVAAQDVLRMPVGVVSPLWLMFAGAATAGVAYWWATRWRYATNLEALLETPAPAPEPVIAAEPVRAVVEAAEAAVENLVEPEVAPEPVQRVAVEPEPAPEPVFEAAPAPTPVVETPTPPIAVEAQAPAPVAKTVSVAPKPKSPPKPKAAAARRAPRTTSGPTRRG